MIKLDAFKQILEIHRRALSAIEGIERIQDPRNANYNMMELQFWKGGPGGLMDDLKKEWIANLYTLSDELMTRYIKYMHYWGGLFKEWIIQDIERLKVKLDPDNEYYEAIWSTLDSTTGVIDYIFREIERYNEINNIDFNALDKNLDIDVSGGGTKLREGELTTEQKIVLCYYLDKHKLLSLNRLSQDISTQATILSSLFGLKWKRTYDRMLRPADLLTPRNLIPVKNVFLQQEATFEGIITDISNDLKKKDKS